MWDNYVNKLICEYISEYLGSGLPDENWNLTAFTEICF